MPGAMAQEQTRCMHPERLLCQRRGVQASSQESRRVAGVFKADARGSELLSASCSQGKKGPEEMCGPFKTPKLA